jgi:hypothetical protein
MEIQGHAETKWAVSHGHQTALTIAGCGHFQIDGIPRWMLDDLNQYGQAAYIQSQEGGFTEV